MKYDDEISRAVWLEFYGTNKECRMETPRNISQLVRAVRAEPEEVNAYCHVSDFIGRLQSGTIQWALVIGAAVGFVVGRLL